jgi:CubicO group peptidase (beta-lactamase class C family)
MHRVEETVGGIEALVQESVAPDGPGASVLVIDEGEVLFQKASGLADVEAGIPNTPATNFRLASVSKQFTAMAIVQLIERGKLTLETTLADLFSTFPDYGREITVWHLLVHSSGLPDYEDFVPEEQTEQLKDRDVLQILQKRATGLFPPGTKYSYSNSAYCVLAQIIEDISGESFAEFLRQNIFEPLGMTNTVAYENGISTVTNRAYGYTPKEGGFERTDQSVTSATLGDGGIYSSTTDLILWFQALSTTTLVSAASMTRIFTPQQSLGETSRAYGFGWFIYDDHGARRLEHDGTTIGFRNYVIRMPDHRRTVLLLMNRRDGQPRKLAGQIVELLG